MYLSSIKGPHINTSSLHVRAWVTGETGILGTLISFSAKNMLFILNLLLVMFFTCDF